MAKQWARFVPGLLCLLSLLPQPPVWSGVKVRPKIYVAEIDGADWTFSGSQSNCELSHEIPGFGIGRFRRLAGEELQFRLESFRRIPVGRRVRMHEDSPPWIHTDPDPMSQMLMLRPGMTPLRLSRRSAAWLLATLAKGQFGSFDFYHWGDERTLVSVRLSPVNYQRPYAAFRRCLRQISDKGYLAYRQVEVQFPFDGDKLDSIAKRQLDALVDFVLADSSISRVEIFGYTDTQGSRGYNRRLSQRRAQGVYDYLVQGGMRPELMQIEAMGESSPKRQRHSKDAGMTNRRVEINLIRDRSGSS
ncbi:MAG: OmpA family protein [Chromatiales bacterium]|jgi:hypothetical protein